MPEFSAQVYWHELPDPQCPASCELNTENAEELMALLDKGRRRDHARSQARAAPQSTVGGAGKTSTTNQRPTAKRRGGGVTVTTAGGLDSEDEYGGSSLISRTRRNLVLRDDMRRQKRARDIDEAGGDGAVEADFTPQGRGMLVTNDLTPLHALNGLMNNLKCRKVSMEELVTEVKLALDDTMSEPSVVRVLNNILTRRNLQAQEVGTAELLQRQRRFYAADIIRHREALLLLDPTKPVFAVALPSSWSYETKKAGVRNKDDFVNTTADKKKERRPTKSQGMTGGGGTTGIDDDDEDAEAASADDSEEGSDCKEEDVGTCFHLMVPIADPAPWVRVCKRLVVAATCSALLIQRQPDPLHDNYPDFAPLRPAFVPPVNIQALVAERLAAGGNPFSAIPILGAGQGGRNQTAANTQRKKSLAVPWYLRFMTTKDRELFKAQQFRKSQVELSVRDTQRSQSHHLLRAPKSSLQAATTGLTADEDEVGGGGGDLLPGRPPGSGGMLARAGSLLPLSLAQGGTQMEVMGDDDDDEDLFA